MAFCVIFLLLIGKTSIPRWIVFHLLMISMMKYLTSTFHLELLIFGIEIQHGSVINVNGHSLPKETRGLPSLAKKFL